MGTGKSAVFIMPRSSSAWQGSEALWVTVAGWAAAAEKRFGNAWVVTTDCIVTPAEASCLPVGNAGNEFRNYRFIKLLPAFIITFLKDLKLWINRNRESYASAPWQGTDVVFVWEQHDLFSGPGRRLATELQVPYILYVHAPIVWEANRWGVKRPGWGKLLELLFEAPAMRKADLVACVSEDVKEIIQKIGVSASKILVSPMAVDVESFASAIGNSSIRQKLKLENKIVIGWTGSFRAFHGLDELVRSFAQVAALRSNVFLILVGDGPERKNVEGQVKELGLTDMVYFSGRIPFEEVPLYVAAFDIAVVSAAADEGFHYSPLKLREYLAGSCAVLAPHVGEIPKLFQDEKHLMFYSLNSKTALVEKMLRLLDNPKLRRSIAEAGYKYVLESGTWDFQLNRVIEIIKEVGR